MVYVNEIPPQPIMDAPSLGDDSFTFDRILNHIDPGPAEESEAFVQFIYEQRRMDTSAEGDDKTGS